MGAKLLKRVANNTNTFAGDGTTTSTLISKALVEHGFNAILFQGAHPVALKRGMEHGLKLALDYLRSMAMPVSEYEEIKNVCLVSSNHN
jgi:chaperonin GroEL